MGYVLKSLISLLSFFANEFRVYLDNNVLYNWLNNIYMCVLFFVF